VFALSIGIIAGSGQRGVYFQDGIPIKSDLGYHDIETGLPIARVDCLAAKNDNYAVSEITGHELCEMAVDPDVTNIITGSWGETLVEICDLFIMPGMTYHIGGIEVPNFTTQAFWGIGPAVRLDMKGSLQPGQVYPYLPPAAYVMNKPPGATAWKMGFSTAEVAPEHQQMAANRAAQSARCQVLLNRQSPRS